MKKKKELWTKENLSDYRRREGWPPLNDQLTEATLEILNSVVETSEKLTGVSRNEPAISFFPHMESMINRYE